MCKSQLLVKNPKYGIKDERAYLPVPCGKCNRCIAAKITGWQWRLQEEFKISFCPLFVTLTYREANVPKHTYEDGYTTRVLNSKDMTDYLKLLRFHAKKQRLDNIRYFYVGEYGTLRHRPHYHMIIWNCDDIRLIQDTWKHGFVHISPLRTMDSVGYCLGYLYDGKGKAPIGFPPFVRMSRGIGRNYLYNPDGSIRKHIQSYHLRKLENCTVQLDNGIILPIPKFFKDRIYDDRQRRKLTKYMQKRIDDKLVERVESIMRATGQDEEAVLHSIYVEPFVQSKKKISIPID